MFMQRIGARCETVDYENRIRRKVRKLGRAGCHECCSTSPVRSSLENRPKSTWRRNDGRAVPPKTMTVLIVEDEPLVRLGAVAIIEDAGYDAISASNAGRGHSP